MTENCIAISAISRRFMLITCAATVPGSTTPRASISNAPSVQISSGGNATWTYILGGPTPMTQSSPYLEKYESLAVDRKVERKGEDRIRGWREFEG